LASYGCAVPITDTGAQLIADVNTCLQTGNGELNVLYYNAKGDGVTSSTAGISNAIAALLANSGNGGTVVLPTGKFVIDGNGLNLTNAIGVIVKGQSYGEPNSGIEHGTELYCETTASIPCVDMTGANDSGLERLNVRYINGGGTVAVMQARSSAKLYSQNNFLRDVYIYWASSPAANGGKGSAGIYNWGSELDTYDNIHIFGADVGLYHTNTRQFARPIRQITARRCRVRTARSRPRESPSSARARSPLSKVRRFMRGGRSKRTSITARSI
jgi:hypothetical protein